jgi:hypothetical protein
LDLGDLLILLELSNDHAQPSPFRILLRRSNRV